jgi:hypothetical protein
MTPEQEKMLREALRLSRENNEMIEKLFKANRRARLWSFLKAIITVALLLGAYYTIAPFIDNLTDAYTGFMEQLQKIGEVRSSLPF